MDILGQICLFGWFCSFWVHFCSIWGSESFFESKYFLLQILFQSNPAGLAKEDSDWKKIPDLNFPKRKYFGSKKKNIPGSPVLSYDVELAALN